MRPSLARERSTHQASASRLSNRIDNLLDVVRLANDLVDIFARPGEFSRAFRAETGQSPAKAIENLRLEAARIMLEDSRHTLDQIAGQTGFHDGRRMREAFLRVFGQPPQVFRRRAKYETGVS